MSPIRGISDLQADIDLVLQLNSPIKVIREATQRVAEAARKWEAHTCRSDLFNDADPDDSRLTTLDTGWLD